MDSLVQESITYIIVSHIISGVDGSRTAIASIARANCCCAMVGGPEP